MIYTKRIQSKSSHILLSTEVYPVKEMNLPISKTFHIFQLSRRWQY